MKTYELTYLATPSLTEEEAQEYHGKIKKIIEKEKGVLGKEQEPLKKDLAYPIKKESKSYLACVDFESTEESANKVSKEIKKEKNVLRHIIARKEFSKVNEKQEERKRKRKSKSLKPEKTKLKEIDKKIDEIL